MTDTPRAQPGPAPGSTRKGPGGPRRARPDVGRALGWGALGLVGLLLVAQLVPYGRDHGNPPVTKAAALDPATRQIVAVACADCHSNLTRWPWYTHVAPASWLAQSDVDGGRQILNFSRWDLPQPALRKVEEAVLEGEMPPLKYRLLPNHADARLSGAERRRLVDGLRRLYATDPPPIKPIGTQPRQ
ncbi:MAG: heme-binding domain-containing protein [Solirubrobacteraceae bacterium]|nr:heme-binding domain-containing protein [Solirubrobacteraceae bacterium]